MKKSLLGLYIVAALLFLLATVLDNDILRSLTKPLPLIALLLAVKPKERYAKLIFVGFIFSLAGDIFLLKTVDEFIFGLSAFLIAHIFYIFAFVQRNKDLKIISALPFYIAAALLGLFFAQYTGDMTIPVLIYITVIVTMAWRAYVQKTYSKIAVYAFWGAVLFVLSDTNIAFTRFYADYKYSSIITMVLYWTAQFYIAKSVNGFYKKK